MLYWSSSTVAPQGPFCNPQLTDLSKARITKWHVLQSSCRFPANPEVSMPIATLPLATGPAISARCRQLLRTAASGAGLLLGALAFYGPATAEESKTLIIPPNDGYGFEECLKGGSPCGLVVANAWCKAHGFAGSQGFGPADGIDGDPDAPAGSIHVTCGGHVD
jgi:hypothetical protein